MVVRRSKPPFPVNLIWNIKVFYIAFIVVMIASLAAVGLAPGLGSSSRSTGAPIDEEQTPVAEETPSVMSFDSAQKTIDPSLPYKAVITTDAGDITIALNQDTPEAANSFAFLAGQNFFDGLQFFWVLPGFDAQAGDPTCAASGELTCTGSGGPGYTLPKEGDPAEAGQWAVIAPVTSPGADQVHGSQFVIALTDGEFEGTPFGHVTEGQQVLESLQQRTPCFGSLPTESNPCQTQDELPQPLTIENVVVEPAT